MKKIPPPSGAEKLVVMQNYKPTDAPGLQFVCMADVEPEPVDWIWSGRLARRKLTLLAGDPGMGKSQISIDITARITTGSEWPDGKHAAAGSVVILSAEDSAGDTLRPRIEAAGADLNRVEVLKAVSLGEGKTRTFSLEADLDQLGKKIRSMRDVALVIFDPLTSYMGKIDSHRTTDVRGMLEPLAKFAETYNVAVLVISHPPKATPSKALHAVTGSLAFVAAARLVFLAIEEPETERRLLLAAKNNLGPLAPGLGYRLAQCIVSKGIVASHVVWDSAPVTVTANQALAASGEANRDHGAMQEAKDLLRDELANGPRPAADIEALAEDRGISTTTLKRARKALKVVSTKPDFEGGWMWRLPNP